MGHDGCRHDDCGGHDEYEPSETDTPPLKADQLRARTAAWRAAADGLAERIQVSRTATPLEVARATSDVLAIVAEVGMASMKDQLEGHVPALVHLASRWLGYSDCLGDTICQASGPLAGKVECMQFKRPGGDGRARKIPRRLGRGF